MIVVGRTGPRQGRFDSRGDRSFPENMGDVPGCGYVTRVD